MKKLFTWFLLTAVSASATAQTKVKSPVLDDYDRNSLSMIIVDRDDDLDSPLFDGVLACEYDMESSDKFDMNDIGTLSIDFAGPRTAAAPAADILAALNVANVGREVVGFWFNRQKDGSMDASVVEKRGNYNADDQAYINAQFGKLGVAALGDEGYKLLGRSYVIVLDYTNVGSSVKDDKTTWTATTNATVFQVIYTPEVQEQVNNAWIYKEDDDAVRERKIAVWNGIRPELKWRAATSYTASAEESDGGLKTAVTNGYEGAVEKLEKLIDEWNVTSAITDRRPLRAKIGKKEGLKNGKRFQAYKYKEDRDGNLKSIPKGYLRATKIADNRDYAQGNSPKSEFYQISGGRIEEGYTLKQKNDLGMGVTLGYKVGDGLAPYNIGIDYLAHINTNGTAHYALLNIGVDVVAGSDIRDKFPGGDSATDGAGITYLNVGVGYGFGIRPIRHIELMPFIMGGGDYMMLNNELMESSDNEDEDEDTFMKKVAWFGNAGLRININVKYPFQIFVQADYSILISEGDTYTYYNDQLNKDTYGFGSGNDKKLGHDKGVGFMAGIKWTF